MHPEFWGDFGITPWKAWNIRFRVLAGWRVQLMEVLIFRLHEDSSALALVTFISAKAEGSTVLFERFGSNQISSA